ncbi:MAG: right-handed parallel beta-helix repeat-containing protein [Hydrogenophilales bacterium]|nr:right-handed parallel beta-helix repeat-containing protein [Hydrogenophilales bacterium]
MQRALDGLTMRALIAPVLAAWLGLAMQAASAQTYFIDDQAGNDAWDGKVAQPGSDGDGPWKSLRKGGLARLQPGDTLALRCGGVWHEALTLTRSGTADQPITVRSYGEPCDAVPLIDAALPVTGWHARPDGILAAALEFTPADVFLNGAYLAPARYPRDGDLVADGSQTGMAFSGLPSALAGKDLAGATVRLRTQEWKIEERRLDEGRQGRLTLDQPTVYPPGKGTRYYLSGKPWMLSYPGAWAFDTQSGELLLRLPAGQTMPSVAVARFDYGLQIVRANHLRIEGLRIAHSQLDGVRVVNSRYVELDGLDVADSGRDGIAIEQGKDIRVLHSVIARSRHDGLVAIASSALVVRDNRVEHSGVIGPPVDSLAAINLEQARDVLVQGNRVADSGYIGIRFHRRARILDNTVEDSCQVLDDCGAIYSWADNDSAPLDSEVSGNTVRGTRASEADNAYRPFNSGIYLDDLSNGVRVKDNTVTATDSGVHIHNGFNLRVEGNTLTDNRRNQIYFSFGHRRPGAELTGNRVIDNTLSYGPGSLGVEIVSQYPGVRHGDFDRNHYRAHGTQAVAYETERPGTETRSPAMFTLERWRSERGQEPHGEMVSTATPRPAIVAQRFKTRFRADDWNAWSPDGSGNLINRGACGGGVDGCIELGGGRTVVLAISRSMPLVPGRNCELRLRTRSDDPDTPVQVRVRRGVPPFAAVGLTTQVLSGPAWTETVLPFRTNALAGSQAQIELKVSQARSVWVAQTSVACE